MSANLNDLGLNFLFAHFTEIMWQNHKCSTITMRLQANFNGNDVNCQARLLPPAAPAGSNIKYHVSWWLRLQWHQRPCSTKGTIKDQKGTNWNIISNGVCGPNYSQDWQLWKMAGEETHLATARGVGSRLLLCSEIYTYIHPTTGYVWVFLTVLHEPQMVQDDTGWSRMIQDDARWY